MKPIYQKADLEIDHYEKPFGQWAVRAGWLYEKVISKSRRGWPDRLMAKKGKVIFFEWKRAGEEPTEQQKKRHEDLRAYGLTVVWFNSVADAIEYFTSLDY